MSLSLMELYLKTKKKKTKTYTKKNENNLLLYYIFPYLCCWIPMRSEPIIWNRWTLNEQNNFFLNTKQTHVCVLRTNACFDCDSLNIVIVRNATANIVLITKTKTNLYILIITIEYLSCINPLIMEWICAGMYDVFFYHQHIKRLKIHQTKNIRMCQLPIVITNTHTHTLHHWFWLPLNFFNTHFPYNVCVFTYFFSYCC